MLSPTVTVLSHTFTQPDPRPDTPKSVTLGIPDNATAGYPPPQAIWFYDAPPKNQDMTPPLPASLLGVPACMVYATSSASRAQDRDTRALAVAIRAAINRMNGETIPLLLHEVTHQVDAQRMWQLFGGRHHVMVMSWLHHGMCEVDFGAGARPRFVDALMPGWIIQLMESRYGDSVDDDDDGDDNADGERFLDDNNDGSETVNGGSDSETKASRPQKEKKRPWYSSGVEISLNLEAEVAEKLSQEPLC